MLRWLAALTAVGALTAVPLPGAGAATPYPDALWAKTMCDLKAFTDWLAKYHQKGYIGEVGWPGSGGIGRQDTAQWNALGEAWYQRADAAKLWVTYHNASEFQGPANQGIVVAYSSSAPGMSINNAWSQSQVVEKHPSTSAYLRGVVMSDGTAGYLGGSDVNVYSNTNPGVYGAGYGYGTAASYQYLAAHGVKLVRLAVRWERLQAQVGGLLRSSELDRLTTAVNAAGAAGIKVILDLHQFGRYSLGSTGGLGSMQVIGNYPATEAMYVDLWAKLAQAFAQNRTVIGLDLMNEPAWIAPHWWHQYSQDAVTAIRANGVNKTVIVEGAHWSGSGDWTRWNPRPWIHDPLGKVRYEAHSWWSGHGAEYKTYAKTVQLAESQGWSASSTCANGGRIGS